MTTRPFPALCAAGSTGAFRLVLASALVVAASVSSARASELEPAPLVVKQAGDFLSVDGDHFGLTWSAAAGGDLSSIRLHDGVHWHEMIAHGRQRVTVPGILVRTAEGTLGQFAPGSTSVVEHDPGRVVVTSESRLASEGGVESELRLTQTFTVYAEGAVFVDFELDLPEGSSEIEVDRATAGWVVDTESFTLAFWHWQQTGDRGSGFLKPQRSFSSPFCPNLGLALGTYGNISNQLQVIVESDSTIGGYTRRVSTALSNGRSFVTRLHEESQGKVRLSPPFSYRNRWGFFLGRHPERSRLAGHRLAYWTEGEESGMPFPSAGALKAMVKCGATAVVLGDGWRRRAPGGVNVPVDEEAFRRFVSEAQALGLKCLVSTLPGGDGEEVGRWTRSQGLDGLFITQASAHYGVFADAEFDFPARATFEWGRALRRGLGPEGLVLIHTNLEGHDLSLGLIADGKAYGTERAEWRAARSTLANAYLGGAGYSTPCPMTVSPKLQTQLAMAIAAATGSVPLVAAGHGAERSIYRAGYALPLWQLYRLAGAGPGIEVRGPGVRAAASSSDTGFWSTFYRIDDHSGLLVVANLSMASQDSSGIAVDFAGLGFSGEYDVDMVIADDLESFTMGRVGRTQNGRIRTGAVPRYGLRGFLFTGGGTPPRIARALDEGLRVATAFIDHESPGPVEGLTLEPVTAGLALSWSPARDNRHVAAYRVYRSPDPDFTRPREVVLAGEVYEETSFRDLGIGPGETWSYSVAAVDVAGNEGRPAQAATGTAPSGTPHFSFSEESEIDRFASVSGAWSFHDSAYGYGCVLGVGNPAVTLLNEPESGDVDVGVKIEDAGQSPFSGGLMCRADGEGRGYALYLGGPAENQLVLARVDRHGMVPLASAPIHYYYPFGCEHTLRLVAKGRRLVGYCDDRALVEADDPTHARGRVGLVALTGHVHFDNLTVNSPAAGPDGAAESAGEGR